MKHHATLLIIKFSSIQFNARFVLVQPVRGFWLHTSACQLAGLLMKINAWDVFRAMCCPTILTRGTLWGHVIRCDQARI